MVNDSGIISGVFKFFIKGEKKTLNYMRAGTKPALLLTLFGKNYFKMYYRFV